MTAAKLNRIFRILSTAGLSLVYEGNGRGKTRDRPPGAVPAQAVATEGPKRSKTSSE